MVNTYSTLAIIWHLIPWNCYKKAKLERPVQMPCHLSDIKIQTCNFINYRIRSSETVTWGLQGPRSKVKVKGQGQRSKVKVKGQGQRSRSKHLLAGAAAA